MAKGIAALLTLLGVAFAQIDRTCIDIAFNSETNTLSGKCQPRDNSGYIPSELDLNDCFGYDGTTITPTYHGNFAESCHGCEMFVAPDPWYGGAEYWIRCTCEGQSEKVAVPLEAAVAHEYVSNKDGHLLSAARITRLTCPVATKYCKETKENMSSHHNLDQTTEYPLSALTFSQLPRPLTLDLLSTEILLQISGEPGKDQTTLSAREFKGLCLLSPSLNKLYLPFHYFSNNHGAFRDAIRDADAGAMDRCVQLGAAPPVPDIRHMKWELPESDGCQCLSELPHTHHRPIDELLESVYLGRAPIDKYIDTLKWLLDRWCDIKEQGDQHWYKANEHCDHVPEFLVTILSKSPDRTHTEGICQMIKLLQDHGYSLPFTMNMRLIRKPMEVALRSHCPPYLLELVLRDYMCRFVKFRVIYVRPPPLIDRWAGDYGYINQGAYHVVKQRWWKSTNLLDTIWGLFLDLMDESTNWEEQYCGEAADIFEQKIEILKEYRVADLGERKILRKIVTAIRSLTTPIKASIAAAAHDREAQRCWETLYNVLISFTSTRGLYVSDTDCMYHEYRLQNDLIRPTIALPWGNMGIKKRDDGRWQDREWMRVVEYEDALPLPERTGDESSERLIEILSNWRLPSWLDGHTYKEIEKIVGERWTELYVKAGVVPRYPSDRRQWEPFF
ncbi:hypothetical protein FPRO06_01787 [Fusarium proliferatum]|nr:hypothetical protein FPRO06_01787 [Fusarium proliferatum]